MLYRQSTLPVTFRMFGFICSFALGHRQPRRYADGKTVSSPLLSLHLHLRKACTVALVKYVPSPFLGLHRRSCHLCTVTLASIILSSSFAPYSITPSPSVLTGYGVCLQKRQKHRLRGSEHLMPWTGGSFPLASLLTRRRFVFRAIFPYINNVFSHFFTISSLLNLWRDRPSLAFRQLHFRQFIRCCSRPEGFHTGKFSSSLLPSYFCLISEAVSLGT